MSDQFISVIALALPIRYMVLYYSVNAMTVVWHYSLPLSIAWIHFRSLPAVGRNTSCIASDICIPLQELALSQSYKHDAYSTTQYKGFQLPNSFIDR